MSSVNSIILFSIKAILALCVLTLIIIWAIRPVLASPFHYPYFIETFDVSRKRNVDIKDYVDRFLCDACNRRALQAHRERIKQWKVEQEAYLETCRLQKRRRRQYAEALDDAHAYCFQTTREQTRYTQQSYMKTPYKVTVNDDELAVDWAWLVARTKKLKAIDYEATLKEYHSKNQRRLMTPKLRQQIKERDNYTCQICGKYMPDEVGLHIDHIVPVAKGGKTVPSNLQVLCSKCNSSKGAKLVDED